MSRNSCTLLINSVKWTSTENYVRGMEKKTEMKGVRIKENGRKRSNQKPIRMIIEIPFVVDPS